MEEQNLPCPHARPSWKMCPWCLGINGQSTDEYVTKTIGATSVTIVKIDQASINAYEEDLKNRQEEHLRKVKEYAQRNQGYVYEVDYSFCMHDACPECVGTGIKIDGSACIHMIACTCKKCSIQCHY